VYILALNKTKRSQALTTLQRPDGSLMNDLKETMKVMRDNLSPGDKPPDDTEYHKRTRKQTKEPLSKRTTETILLLKSRTPSTNYITKKLLGKT
jgi:hypothetical protein